MEGKNFLIKAIICHSLSVSFKGNNWNDREKYGVG
jgi:hypothetical protein